MTGPERRRLATSQGELSWVEFGEGPAVVLLHGWPSSSYMWRREILLFASRMRVLAPDLLGYGESEKPEGADLSLRGQAAVVREMLASLRVDEFAVVGHGFGGGVAQLLALEGGVRSLALVDSVAFDAWPSRGLRELQALEPATATLELARDLIEAWLSRATGKTSITGEDAAPYLAPWRADPGALLRASRGLDGQGLAGHDEDLSALGIPAFVIWGEQDEFLAPALAERLGELFDGSMVALLPGCGHLVTEDAPQTVGPLLYEFLRRAYLGEEHAHATSGPVPVFLHRPSERDLREAGLGEED